MPRTLALDLGDRKTGVAVTDPAGTMALPHSILRGDPVPQVLALVAELGVGTVVVGRPRALSGAETDQTATVDRTVVRLRAALGDAHPVVLVDERLSSRQVQSERAAIGASRRARRSDDDAEAATLLLADYLTSARA